MARRPAIMLYKGDWKRDPELSMCSPATRGIWIDLICDMDDLGRPTITGTTAMIARTCRASESEVLAALLELKSSGAALIALDGDIYAVTSRRMKREMEISDIRAQAVQTRYKTATNAPTKHVQNAEDENANEDAVVVVIKPKADAEKLYRAYPRKIGKSAAIRAINSAFHRLIAGESTHSMDGLAANDFLLRATESFARSPAGNSEKFTPHPATWFNQSRYLDDPNEWHRNGDGNAKLGNRKADSANTALARAQARAVAEACSDGEASLLLSGPGGGDGRDSPGKLLESSH